MRARILGKVWQLFVVPFNPLRSARGTCDDPKTPKKEIIVQDDQFMLDTVLHECLHAGFWHVDEGYVTKWATDVAKILTDLGYTRDPSVPLPRKEARTE